MKYSLLSAIGLVAFAAVGTANAADLAARPYLKAPPIVAPIYDWTGVYIGGNGGWASSRKCWDRYSLSLGGYFPEGCHNADGAVAGGQIGYRWQTGTWVFGVEAQGDWADLKGSHANTLSFLRTPGDIIDRTKIDALGLFTGQVGYAWNNVLLYVKGGAAVTNDKYSRFAAFLATPEYAKANETRWGGAAGAGLEFGFAPNWSVGVEYDHLFMGERNVDFTRVNNGNLESTVRIKQDVDLVTARVNYRFGGPVIAKY